MLPLHQRDIFGAHSRIRTDHLFITSELLYQMSYVGLITYYLSYYTPYVRAIFGLILKLNAIETRSSSHFSTNGRV